MLTSSLQNRSADSCTMGALCGLWDTQALRVIYLKNPRVQWVLSHCDYTSKTVVLDSLETGEEEKDGRGRLKRERKWRNDFRAHTGDEERFNLSWLNLLDFLWLLPHWPTDRHTLCRLFRVHFPLFRMTAHTCKPARMEQGTISV